MTRFWLDDEEEHTWTLQDIYDDLASRTDIAAMLDVTIWRMERWLYRRDRIKCPMPIKRIGSANVYSKQEWRDWYARWTSDPRRAKWMQNTKGNGSGLPFMEHTGPDRGWSTRKVIMRHRAAADAAATSPPAADD